MLMYEHSRAEEFVDDLLLAAKRTSQLIMICIITNSFVIGATIGLGVTPTREDPLIGLMIGAVVGIALGWFVGTIFQVIVLRIDEWMAQVLIAQGEMKEHLRTNGTP